MVNECVRKRGADADEVREIMNDRVKLQFTRKNTCGDNDFF